MTIYTDNVRFAQGLFKDVRDWKELRLGSLPSPLRPYLEALTPKTAVQCSKVSEPGSWGHAVLIESADGSQFDALNRVARRYDAPPEGLVCVAGTGTKFHGFKDRPWEIASGNLHLSVLTGPRTTIDHVGVAFIVLAVVSVLQTLDDVAELPQEATVKWVNDIMIEGAKIGGVLANCQIQDDIVTHATLGIGLNVEKAPPVSPTPSVPTVGSLHQFSPNPRRCTLEVVFQKLITYLGANYASLMAGGYQHLLDVYRSRSLVLAQRVRLHRDSVDGRPGATIEGVVQSIGEDLELFLDQRSSPVTEGRLELLTR